MVVKPARRPRHEHDWHWVTPDEGRWYMACSQCTKKICGQDYMAGQICGLKPNHEGEHV